MKTNRWIVLVCVFLFGLTEVSAQDSTEPNNNTNNPTTMDIQNSSLEEMLNIKVTTASKLEQKQSEAPGIITVLPREQFSTYGWYSLNDAIYHQAGFFPSRDYDRRTIGSRGLFEGWNNNHILLLMDGVPFNDPMYGTAYTSEITPITMIKSVEVLRGPGSALYGTNATNGVIALHTYSGGDLDGKLQASYRYGSYNTNQWDLLTGNKHDRFSYTVAASGLSTTGLSYDSFDNSGLTDAGGDLRKATVMDDRSNRYLFFKAEGEGGLKGLSFSFHDQSWNFQTGHGWLFAIPDQRDIMRENRQIVTASYQPTNNPSVSPEFTFKYERKEIDWYTRYLPNGASYPVGVTTYNDGITEYLNFNFDHFFARAQSTWKLNNEANFLAGVEGSVFLYKGDKTHLSNTDLNDTFLSTSGNVMSPANPALGLIKDRPLTNIGVYLQLLTGQWISDRFPVTLGLRYDSTSVSFDESKASPAGDGTGNRSFNQLSPRLAGVFLATSDLSFKFLAGQAFRAPAPSELAGVNTWALANNIRNLKPETVTTFEVGSDWRVTENVNWKLNVFHTKFADQIGYNLSQANLSTNIYTTTTLGAETEVTYSRGDVSAFFNASYSKRLSEEVTDTEVDESDSTVTWAPSFTANLGASYNFSTKAKGSLVTQYMGDVKRRTSDRDDATYMTKRGSSVPGWVTLAANVQYKLFADGQLDFTVKNIFDQSAHLIKNRDYPFDYEMEGRAYYLTYTHTF